MNRKIILIIIDIIIVFFAFFVFIWIKPATIRIYLPNYLNSIIIFEFIWLFVSLLINKFSLKNVTHFKDVVVSILISNATVLAITSTLIIFFHFYNYSRLIIFGTIGLATILELIVGYLYYYDEKKIRKVDFVEPQVITPESIESYGIPTVKKPEIAELDEREIKYRSSIQKQIIDESGENVFDYISDFVNVYSREALIIATTTRFNIDKQPEDTYKNIINIKRSNSIRRINKFFESVNHKLPSEGIFIGCAETFDQRNSRIKKRYPIIVKQIFIFFDFVFRRVFPKLFLLKNIYFFITKGRNRVISKAEILGRLASCGFEIIDYKELNGLIYFITKKVKEPAYDLKASYGPLFKMRRIGKNGKIIYVYKFRTMHPYAEYLQDYVLKVSGYSEIGKPADDFRLTKWGKFLRKYWLDELPQLINVLKGEMRLVGIRPLSQRFLAEYPEDVLEMRLKHKPGCVPPYVALLKQDVEEYIESERIYLQEKEKKPFTTDIKYLFKAFYNIFTNKIRSA